jgi:3-hydroxy-3-methylglutaryl CoA synthase
MNEDIKNWVNELKIINDLNKEHKKKFINFNNYFKYSGKVEEEKKEEEFEINIIKSKKIIVYDDVVQFYFDNPNYTIEEIAKVFKIGNGTVRGRIDRYFNNRKKLENGKNIKDGECK